MRHRRKVYLKKYKVGMVSLGCDKNRVDSEIILGAMKQEYEIINKADEADIIIINTCGFIEKAKEESINTILEMAKYKETSNCKLLIATGCLTQRYGKELKELIPEIDIMLGVNDYKKIDQMIREFIKTDKGAVEVNYSDENINEGERVLTTAKHTAYIRIAEGCNNFCTYCVIPKIRGKFRSRKLENILEEARSLRDKGVKEIILVAQDTTLYGSDLYGQKSLHILIKQIAEIEGIEWIRVLYCYPEEIYDELLEEIKENDKVTNYLDLPIQHISSRILKLMGRKTNKEDIIEKINIIRKKIPDVIIRTSLIVGFPGETLEDFKELVEFLKEYKLEKVGVFRYSREEGTAAAKMKEQIEEDIKAIREKELMLVQGEVSREINKLKINNKYDILVEGFNGEYYHGRNYQMVPEIDGKVFFKSDKEIESGTIINVKITKCTNYDLIGVVTNESCK